MRPPPLAFKLGEISNNFLAGERRGTVGPKWQVAGIFTRDCRLGCKTTRAFAMPLCVGEEMVTSLDVSVSRGVIDPLLHGARHCSAQGSFKRILASAIL